MAHDVAAMPEGEVIAFCAALDAQLQETAGIGLSQVASYIDSQQGQQPQETDKAGAMGPARLTADWRPLDRTHKQSSAQ